MTRQRATQILIRHAAANVAGVGCGIRPEIRRVEVQELARAIRRLWNDAYAYELTDEELSRMGVSP